MHKNWGHFWWAILQHFGRECKKTWGGEVIAVLVGGIAGAGTTFLRTRGQVSFTDAVVDGVICAALFFAMYIFVHLLRSPWLERKSEGVAPSAIDGIFGAVMFFLLLGGSLLVCRLIAWDLQSSLTLHSVADTGGNKSDELTALETCKTNYATLTQKEPDGSLRRRTMRLANEISDYLRGRFESHPPYAYPSSSDPNPSEERKAAIKKAVEYDQRTQDDYLRKYKDRAVGIIREYREKGVTVGFLEQSFGTRVPIWAMPGAAWEESPQNELAQFRELAFHVDAKDQLISPDF
jgi:hypothetical protein